MFEALYHLITNDILPPADGTRSATVGLAAKQKVCGEVTNGGSGVGGWELMTALNDAKEVQVPSFTLKV